MLHGEFDQVHSVLDIFVKDMGLVTGAARDATYPAPLAAAAEQRYLAARRAGLGRLDDAAIIEISRGLPPRRPDTAALRVRVTRSCPGSTSIPDGSTSPGAASDQGDRGPGAPGPRPAGLAASSTAWRVLWPHPDSNHRSPSEGPQLGVSTARRGVANGVAKRTNGHHRCRTATDIAAAQTLWMDNSGPQRTA